MAPHCNQSMMQWSGPNRMAFCVVTKASAITSTTPNVPAPFETLG
jgi:hypothetical protein